MVGPGQLSITPGAASTTARHTPASVRNCRGTGQRTVGGSTSLTVTSKVQVLVLPAASLAKQLWVVVPTGVIWLLLSVQP